MKHGVLSSVLILLLFIPAIANANYIGDITVECGDRAWLAHSDKMYVNFSYKVDGADGARMKFVPYENGNIIPPYAWSPSPLYPEGTGTGSGYCRVTSGDWTVTHIQVTMFNGDWSEELLEIFVPVRAVYSTKGISNLSFNYDSPAWIRYGQALEFTHDVTTDEAGYLFARPYYEGALVSGYGAGGGEHVSPPNDSVSHYFFFGSGSKQVDTIRFYLKDLTMTEVLWECFVPVNYHWGEHGLSNFSFSRTSPQIMAYEERLECTFDYSTGALDSVRVWMLGADDNGVVWQDMVYGGSPILPPPSGTIQRYFRFTADKDITKAHFKMVKSDHSETYMEIDLPFDVTYRAHSVNQLTLTPGAPAILDIGERVYADYAYYTTGTNQVRIWPYGIAQGVFPPQGNAGSPTYDAPSGWANNFFLYSGTDPIYIDQVMVRMRDAVTDEILIQDFYPAEHYFGHTATATGASDAVPAAMTELLPNYPNPFNPKTTISFNMGEAGAARLAVFDVRGRLVRTLLDRDLASGPHAVDWNGRDDNGDAMPSGIYLSKLMTATEDQTRKMVLVK